MRPLHTATGGWRRHIARVGLFTLVRSLAEDAMLALKELGSTDLAHRSIACGVSEALHLASVRTVPNDDYTPGVRGHFQIA